MAERYDPLGPMIAALPEKTGRPFEAWVAIVADKSLATNREIVAFLKKDHGLSHGYANAIALKLLGSDAASSDPAVLLEQMFRGKEAIRPLYDEAARMLLGCGQDVETSPKKNYVSFRRSRQFAVLQPSTRDRLDLGLCLRDAPETASLKLSGSWNKMVSHRVQLHSIQEIDERLRGWVRTSYDLA